MTMVEEKQYAVDQEKLKEYFPMEVATAGMMDIYQKILGLKFTRLEGGEVWHEDVEMWRVRKYFIRQQKIFTITSLEFPRWTMPRAEKTSATSTWTCTPVTGSTATPA